MSGAQQPLHSDVEMIFSVAADGSMASGGSRGPMPADENNTTKFLKRHGFSTERYRVGVRYGSDRSYTEVERIDQSASTGDIICDALYTTLGDKTIVLPVADCIATVVYDPVTHMLGVLHLGRHSSVAGLIESFVIEVADNVGSDPRDWLVWMSPSLKQDSDRLDYFEPASTKEWQDFVDVRPDGIYLDTPGHNKARFIRAGVPEANIEVSPVDTYVDVSYFSNRAANQLTDSSRQGRMIVAVRLR